MKVISAILPGHCYSDSFISPDKTMAHYFSNMYADPGDPFNPDNCIQLLIDLNHFQEDRQKYLLKDSNKYYASYHYMIARNGDLYHLAPTNRKAYHAGRGEYPGIPKNMGNSYTLGVACLATDKSGFTDDQYKTFNYINAKHNVRESMGHEHYAPGRKVDPGNLFDWTRLQNVKIP